MSNLLFLDVDGVLNCSGAAERTPDGYVGIMPSRVKLLARIVRENDAVIILSSSWKEFWSRDRDSSARTAVGDYLDEALAAEGLRIEGRTPGLSWERGRGIYAYLQSHPHGGWVVLDDDVFEDFRKYGILGHQVRTDWSQNGGLQEKHVRMARKLFRLPPEPVLHSEEEEDRGRALRWHFGRKL